MMNPLTDEYCTDNLGETEEPPEYLYHYTSISNLALILENKTIRFTRLDLVNDPTEATADVDNANQLIFASCWTAEKQDELSMWKMYCPHKLGVRIKLPRNPFKSRDKSTSYEPIGSFTRVKVFAEIERQSSINKSLYIYGPNSISYTDDPKVLKTRCYFTDDERIMYHLLETGLYKHRCWSFEKEWRYRTVAVPMTMADHVENDYIRQTLDLVNDPVISRYADIPLDKNSLKKMEITLYPDPDPALRLLVEALLHKHNIEAPVLDSKLKVKW